ncbi:hemerythrin domain-containing protein [Bdellovibrionota bacterium FG-1]
MELAPSVVRKIILEEHEQLRTKLKAIENLIERKDFGSLQNQLRELQFFFLKHIAQEESILRPVLKDLDAWGDVRVERMNAEHAAQRKEIQALDQLILTGKPDKYLEPVKKFIEELYCDMASEEKECLHPDVLKDDPISINTSCG